MRVYWARASDRVVPGMRVHILGFFVLIGFAKVFYMLEIHARGHIEPGCPVYPPTMGYVYNKAHFNVLGYLALELISELR